MSTHVACLLSAGGVCNFYCVLQRIGAAGPFPGAAMSDDVQASNQRADEEAAALAKAAAEAERKVRNLSKFRFECPLRTVLRSFISGLLFDVLFF